MTAQEMHELLVILAIAGYMRGNERVRQLAKAMISTDTTANNTLLVVHASGNNAHTVVLKALENL